MVVVTVDAVVSVNRLGRRCRRQEWERGGAELSGKMDEKML